MAVVLRLDGTFLSTFEAAQLGQLFRQAAGSGEQEVTTSAGGIDNADGEQGLHRVSGLGGQALVDDGVECAVDELLHQAVGCVVAACELAVVAGHGAGSIAFCIDADEAEAASGQIDLGHEFEQALVHAAQFFGVHVAVVDGRQRRAGLPGPAQAIHGGQQVGIAELGGVKRGALRRGE